MRDGARSAKPTASDPAEWPHLSLHYTGLAEPLLHEFEIRRVLVGQDFATVFQRIVGIDAKHLLPCRAGLGETAQMAVAGGQKRARDVGNSVASQPLHQEVNGLFVPSKLKRGQSLEVQKHIRKVWIQGLSPGETL